MRIIAGSARSLPLKTPDGLETRPTSDKIKETLFNMLQREVPGSYFLDLFAGSGQIGLEALSRGANYAVFVDNGRKPAECIEHNIKFTKFDKQAALLTSDAVSAIHMMDGKYRFDLIFMDPPYGKGYDKEVLAALAQSSLLKEDARIICEEDLHADFSYVEELGYEIVKVKEYKTNKHVFLERKNG